MLIQFAANNYQKPSIDKIASGADVSKGLIFQYFEKKQILSEKHSDMLFIFLTSIRKIYF